MYMVWMDCHLTSLHSHHFSVFMQRLKTLRAVHLCVDKFLLLLTRVHTLVMFFNNNATTTTVLWPVIHVSQR